MSDDGWTKSYRRKWRHPVFRNFRDAAIWAYLTDNAAWQDYSDVRFEDGPRIVLMRGQIAVSERYLANGFSCDRQVIRRVLDALETDHMITRTKTTSATIVTICNYGEYQSCEEAEKPTIPTGKTQVEPTSNPPVNPNSEEDKNSKNFNTGGVGITRSPMRIVGERVIEIMRAEDDPNWRGNYSLAEVWLKRGFDPELDIYPTVERLVAQNQGAPISTLKYFDRAITQAHADRTRTIQEASNVSRFSQKPAKHTRESDRRALLAAFDLGTGGDGLGGNTDAEGQILDGEYRRSH